MKHIRHKTTLVYYDGPQVFEAQDKIGGHYIAMSIAPPEDEYSFLVVGVSPEGLRRFRTGGMDLRTLLLEAEESEWYTLGPELDLDGFMELTTQKGSLAKNKKLLPDEGFYIHHHSTDKDIVSQARERNTSILQITTEPPESAEGHLIRVDTYTQLLKHMQTLVQHAYKSSLDHLPQKSLKSIDTKDAFLMNVLAPASPGSFQFTLESVQRADFLGDIEIVRGLKLLDLLFGATSDPQSTIELLTNNRRRLSSAYLKFMEFLAEHDIGLSYSWAEPSSISPSRHSVSQNNAKLLVRKLSKIKNLGIDTISFEGEVDKVDRTKKTWQLDTKEGKKSGSVHKGGPTLHGIKIGARYRFICDEETSITEGTGAKNTVLFLSEYEPI